MSGSKAPVEDFLEEDSEIPSQRYVLMSFLSPEKVLARKDQFFFGEFLRNYEITWKTKNLEKFLAKQVMDFNAKLDAEANRLAESEATVEAAELCRKSRIPVDHVLGEYQAFLKENAKEITATTIKESFDDYMFSNEKKLEEEFHKKNNFQTTVRGLKIRGSYPTQEEATARAKKLQRNDPIHNIFVAEVGKWLAWDPNPHNVASQEYQNDQLNELMRSYKQNEEQREQFFKENPEAKRAAQKPGVIGAAGEQEAAAPTAAVVAGAAATAVAQMESMMHAPDLALQRKLEREAAAAAAKEVAKEVAKEEKQD